MAFGIRTFFQLDIRNVTDEGKNILSAIRKIRALHRDVALLLRTADVAMNESHWVNAKSDSTALRDLSYSIDGSDKWMPREVFRYYRRDEQTPYLASIAVLLDDTDNRLSEPVVSASVFDFGQTHANGNFPTWLASIYLALPNPIPDGEFNEISMQQLDQSWQSGFKVAWCFACPLVEITTESDLRQNIVGKLLNKTSEIVAG